MKFLHQLGAVGSLGGFAACVVLVALAPRESLVEYAAWRAAIVAVGQWLLVPSLALVLVSGLLAIAIHRPYHDAGWAWVKALLGLVMFEGTLVTISGSARRAAELSALAAAGEGDPAKLAEVLRTEWGSLWLILALSIANIVLAVWRPKLRRRPAADEGTA
jgi:uncharacterized membrane protein